jgi:hypothetical protein
MWQQATYRGNAARPQASLWMDGGPIDRRSEAKEFLEESRADVPKGDDPVPEGRYGDKCDNQANNQHPADY